MDHYRQQFSAEGHRLGGYPYLTQQDLREDDSEKILLFQLDSDDEMEISWGDNGIAHFFVHPTDIKSLDFSRVLYEWACQ